MVEKFCTLREFKGTWLEKFAHLVNSSEACLITYLMLKLSL